MDFFSDSSSFKIPAMDDNIPMTASSVSSKGISPPNFFDNIREKLRGNQDPVFVNYHNISVNKDDDFTHNLTIYASSLALGQSMTINDVVIIIAYTLIVIVSVFGNTLVCHVVIKTRRMHTITNMFITNLAFSDLLITTLNIPFNIAKILLNEWPFGSFLCHLVPFIQITGVYVSTFTMTSIALDRYKVIMWPLHPRLTILKGFIIIIITWILASTLSLPYAIYHLLEVHFTYAYFVKCMVSYPTKNFRKWLSLATFITQYVIPLSITTIAYIRISQRLWSRDLVGHATEEQQILHTKTKQKTTKMLILVVALFATCWLPLNFYHLYADFSGNESYDKHNPIAFFVCHWLAMSSVCYNPFIYCWLNEHFRAGAKNLFRFCNKHSAKVYPGIEIDGILVRFDSKNKRHLQGPQTGSLSLRSDSVKRQPANNNWRDLYESEPLKGQYIVADSSTIFSSSDETKWTESELL